MIMSKRRIQVHVALAIFHDAYEFVIRDHGSVFKVQRMSTYIHTDTTCVQQVNVGLTQARPNNTCQSQSKLRSLY